MPFVVRKSCLHATSPRKRTDYPLLNLPYERCLIASLLYHNQNKQNSVSSVNKIFSLIYVTHHYLKVIYLLHRLCISLSLAAASNSCCEAISASRHRQDRNTCPTDSTSTPWLCPQCSLPCHQEACP